MVAYKKPQQWKKFENGVHGSSLVDKTFFFTMATSTVCPMMINRYINIK